MARKTTSVEEILIRANVILAMQPHAKSDEFKMGVIMMLEEALFSSGNYKGFRYLTDIDSPDFNEYMRQYS